MDVLAGGGEWILTGGGVLGPAGGGAVVHGLAGGGAGGGFTGGEMAGRVSTRDVGGGRRESPHQTSKSSSFLSDRVIHEGLIPVTSLCVDTEVLLAQVGLVAKVEIMILNFDI